MEDFKAKPKYQLHYTTKYGAQCKTSGCKLPPFEKGDFRIGTVGSVTSWYHVECFFKRVTADRMETVKIDFEGREKIKPEDLALVDELSKKALDEYSVKKRKADKIAEKDDGRWPKKQKYDYLNNIEPPTLSNDCLLEVFRYFQNQIHILRALALVNKQFYSVSRSLMYKYGAGVAKRVIWNMEDKWMTFVQNFQKLTIQETSHVNLYHEVYDSDTDAYLRVLTKLSNLSSLTWNASDGVSIKMAVATRLTQLSELKFDYAIATEEDMQRFTVLTALKSLAIDGSGKFEQMDDGLLSFATQLKNLTMKSDCFNLRPFSNLESLDLSGSRKREGIKAVIESLSKLTSLVTYNFASDMSKLTKLKSLTLSKYGYVGGNDQQYAITAFPPNLEHFKCNYETIKCDFPATTKSISVCRIENELYWNEIAAIKAKFETMMAAISKLRCPVTLNYMDIDQFEEKRFNVATVNPNLIIIMEEDRYTETVLKRFEKFAAEGPYPGRLEITFKSWKRATRKKKFGQVLEDLSKKMVVRAEYEDHGHVWRPMLYDGY